MKSKTGYLALSLAVAVAMYSCNSEKHQDNTTSNSALSTDFIPVNAEDVELPIGYPGSIEGQDNVEIKAQVTGYLEAVYVKEGQYVNRGQLLFKINPSVYNQQVNNNQAALKAAMASQSSAKLEMDKLKPLVEGNVVSEMQLKIAQANYQAASAQVAQAQASLLSSKINAGFTYIKAPVSGYIGRIPSRIGSLIAPSDPSPMTTLSNISNINVYFSMNEADFIRYNKSLISYGNKSKKVEIILPDGETYPYKGNLEAASGNFDRNTASIQMKAVFQNPDRLLRAGGTVRVMVYHNVNNVIKIPKTAVKDIQDKYFVYKLGQQNKVQMVAIEVSGETPQDYFVSSGIEAGDKIAINRMDGLTDGAAVLPKVISNHKLVIHSKKD
ncbi:efflux RND transporter periplasmic adaptor subunit [Elizabethkingia argentiflava]|uniref:Efflux RND transporter periplasmic adaptor subunit n=1 Tax=Elizabethkingia argenteiflava TaxID=2681556 RepID=A0A845PQF6_9FLAO|nr:efflux RND transporter periplasmic adaptor subunit [Elizabethkingia argenteiflava]NAW50064.1 efflux RND transporter periplasmic adaptor subunit [Elizabethkingia argenteiflava]